MGGEFVSLGGDWVDANTGKPLKKKNIKPELEGSPVLSKEAKKKLKIK